VNRFTGLDQRAKAAIAVAVILAAAYLAGTVYMEGWPAAPTLPSQPESYESGKGRPASMAPPEAEKGFTAPGGASGAPGDAGSGAEPLEPPSRMIAYTASVTIEAPDVVDAARRVEEVAARLGGYVSWESISTGERPRAVVKIKVPVEHYREALEEIKSIGRLVSVSQKAEDVTNRYIDLQARLRNLKAEEQRLIELLGRARNVGEVIQVEDRLRTVRTQIEYIEAMLKNLERSVEYATITVTITAPQGEQPLPTLDWGKVVRDAVETAYRVIAGLVVLVVGLSPLWAILAAIYLVYRSRRGQAPKGQQPGATPQQ